jgi:hypothetical protein
MTTEIPTTPVSVDDAAFEVMRTDAVLGGRAMSSGEYLAGLLAAGELSSAARPDRLPADLFPGGDPALVQEVWDRAIAVGFHAGRLDAASSRFREDELAGARDQFVEMGHHAMGGLVARSRGLVERARQHPGDGEIAREHH